MANKKGGCEGQTKERTGPERAELEGIGAKAGLRVPHLPQNTKLWYSPTLAVCRANASSTKGGLNGSGFFMQNVMIDV